MRRGALRTLAPRVPYPLALTRAPRLPPRVRAQLLTANFAFTALLAIVGPSGEFGDIHALFGRICARRQGDAKGAPADVQVA